MIRPPAYLALCFLLSGLLFTGQPIAAEDASTDPWDGPPFSLTAEELLAAAGDVPGEEGDEVRILLRESDVRFEADGRRTEQSRIVYRILTPAGVENWASTFGVWSPWYQERPRLRSRVVTADGTEHWLDPATIAEEPVAGTSPSVLTDRRRVKAPLPNVSVGAVIEEYVETRDLEPMFDAGTVGSFDFVRRYGVHRTRLVLDAPESLPLRYRTQLLDDLEPRRTESGGRVVLTFESGPREGVESVEQLAPGTVPLWARVLFSTGESWSSVASHYSKLADGQLAGMDLGDVVSRVVGAVEGREEKVARLLAWLHEEIRYTGLEFGEAAIVPRSPAETLERGYGDCKDKATLLVALLRTAGIPADLALLDTGPGMDLEPELPGLGGFDHAIVFVPGAPELWIDATSEYAHVGELPYGDEGRLALVANPATSGLVTIPVSGPEENRLLETREIFLEGDLGGARIIETSRYWGYFERGERAYVTQTAPEDVREALTDYVKSTYYAKDLSEWSHSDPKDLSVPFELRLEAVEADLAFTDLSESRVFITTGSLLQKLPKLVLEEDEDEKEDDDGIAADVRQADLELPVPYTAEHRYRIVPPEGYQPVSLPESKVRRLGPATLSQEVVVEDDGTVLVNLRFDTGKRRLTPDELQALHEGVREILDEEDDRVGFEQVAEAHLAAGEISEALAEIDRLIALAPEKALPRTRRARALLEAGLGDAARREAEAAVQLEGDLALAHHILGWILQHDLVGRESHPGMDLDRAVAAYRKAKELDPENEITRRNLAILLEHDAGGHRYSSQARLDEAIEEYVAQCDDSEMPCLEENLRTALVRAGRFEEVLERARKAGTAPDAYTLVATAALKGPRETLKESRKIYDAGQRRQALAGAGNLLMNIRLYPESAAMFSAVARGADDASTLVGLVAILEKTRRLEEVELSMGRPEDAVWLLMIAAMKGDRDGVLKLAPRLSSEDLADLDEVPKVMSQLSRVTGISTDVFLELGMGGLKVSLDGDDDLGYRVRMRSEFGGIKTDESYFVASEEGGFRVAATDLPSIGREVLRLLDAEKLDAAHQWLDWAYDEMEVPGADDPFAGEPFFRFWSRDEEGTEPAMRVAAASLVAGHPRDESAVAILKQGRQETGEDGRLRFDLALARAYTKEKQHKALARLARQWLAEHVDSVAAFTHLRTALLGLKKWDELELAGRERLEAIPEDPLALRTLAGVARRRGELAEQRRYLERLTAGGKALYEDYRALAWTDVALGQVDEETLENAQQAAVNSEADDQEKNLRVLASVYAELDQPKAARDILHEAMGAGLYDEPGSVDWYVWGRIAESYGVLDSAAEAYHRVKEPKSGHARPDSVYALAERRLAAMKSQDGLRTASRVSSR